MKVFVLIVIVAAAVYFGGPMLSDALGGPSSGASTGQAAPAPAVVMDQGVFLPQAAVQSVFPGQRVYVHASPPDAGTLGAKSVDQSGTLHVWVPNTFGPGMSNMTISEAQEHVLRQLSQCQGDECKVDAGSQPFDPNILKQMVTDPNVPRAGDSSNLVSTYMLADTFKVALEEQAEVAMHGMDSIVAVAKSGDLAQGAAAVSDSIADGTSNLLTAVLVIGGIVLVFKLFGGGGGGGGGGS
jgi:hypothetical protein